MKALKTKEDIKKALIRSLEDEEDGIYVKAGGMGSGSHHYWLTGDIESYEIHCYGRGQGWCDQSDECGEQNLDKLVDSLWTQRAQIIELLEG